MQIDSGGPIRAAASARAIAWVMLGAWSLSFSAAPAGSPPVGASAATAPIDAETQLRDEITNKVKSAWAKGDFAQLDAMAESYARTQAKTLSGKWELSVFYAGLSDAIEIPWDADGYLAVSDGMCSCKVPDPARYQEADRRWDAVFAKAEQWVERFPASPHARIALAQYFVNRAWFYRGTGPSNAVPEAAWPKVSRYIEEARTTLIKCKSQCIADPQWFEVIFFVAAAQSWTHEQIDDQVKDLLDRGQAYVPGYQSAARLLLPKWGGTYEDVETFAQLAVARTQKAEGTGMYARIYWNLGDGPALFAATRADWPTMKRGFEEILAKYPDPRNLNGEAMFACEAGDGATFKAVMKQLGNRIIPSIWLTDLNYCLSHFGA